MAGYWNRPSWWSPSGWDSNAQEGGGRTWEASVSEDNDSTYRRNDRSAAHSWEPMSTPAPQTPGSSGPKRAHPASPPEEQEPSSKRPRIDITDAIPDEVNRSGNMVGDDVKWVSQEDPLPLGHPITQAIWLVAEKFL